MNTNQEAVMECDDCPFCGSSANVMAYPLGGALVYQAVCNGDKRHSLGNYYTSPDDAASEWNERRARK
jgi:hypothetical protein